MGARERGQCSRKTRVGSLSRALHRAFLNERMVRAGTREMMYHGCCLPFSATPGDHLVGKQRARPQYTEEAALVDTDETREAAACERYVSNWQHYVAWAGRQRISEPNPPSPTLIPPDSAWAQASYLPPPSPCARLLPRDLNRVRPPLRLSSILISGAVGCAGASRHLGRAHTLSQSLNRQPANGGKGHRGRQSG